jgi:hypothetical protein
MTLALLSSGGMNHWQLWVFGNKRTANQPISTQLNAYQFLYPDATAAEHAYQQMQYAFFSACPTERLVDAQTGQPLVNTVDETAVIPYGFAFVHTLRTAAGKPVGTATLMPDNHEYLVQRGSILALIEINATTATIDQFSGDEDVLQQMAEHLCTTPRQHC